MTIPTLDACCCVWVTAGGAWARRTHEDCPHHGAHTTSCPCVEARDAAA